MVNEMTAYFRPKTLVELDEILAKFEGKANFLAGGNYDSTKLDETAPLIDLQDLGLDQISSSGSNVAIGGLANLQQLGDAFQSWDGLQEALSVEAGLNVRNSLSLANFLRSADGRSPLLCVLLALALTVELLPSGKSLPLEKYLVYQQGDKSEVVSKVTLTLPKNLAYEAVARAPKDRPLVCMAAALDDSGGLRIACGGMQTPPQVLSVPRDPQSAFDLVRRAYEQGDDAWASATYRQAMSQVLLRRLLQSLGFLGLEES